MSYAMRLYETMRNQLSINNNSASINAVQFPAETLIYRSGSNNDMVLLFASCLESVGISSALIQTETELLVAVSLGVNQSAAETLVNGTNKILIVGNNVRFPLSMTVLREGFMSAFSTGANAEFVIVQNAWQVFPSAPHPEIGRTTLRVDNAAVIREAGNIIQ